MKILGKILLIGIMIKIICLYLTMLSWFLLAVIVTQGNLVLRLQD